jgi:hypothetical protein
MTYEEILGELRGRINVHANDYVPRLAKALKSEDSNKSGSDIVDIIKRDCGYWSKETIRKYIPEDLKDKVKQNAGREGKKKQLITIGNTGQSLPDSNRAENNPKSPKEPNSGDSNVDKKLDSINARPKSEIEELKEIVSSQHDQIQERDRRIDTLETSNKDLTTALKKSSFKAASDPDNLNEDYDSKIAIPMLITKLRGKMASGWHFVENRMRYIS